METTERTAEDQRLDAYLNDHLAGSAAAIRLVRRIRDREEDPLLARALESLLGDIEKDRTAIQRVLSRIGAGQSNAKQVGAVGAEMVIALRTRLPVVGPGSGEIGRLEELELLSLGIEGKRLMWETLRACSAVNPKLLGFDFAKLERSARAQRDRVERFRLELARQALAA